MEIEVMNVIEYIAAQAIIEKANAYWRANATYSKDGSSSLSAELAKHPDYAACSNDLRGRVEQYEILKSPPEQLTAYVSTDETAITVWTGQIIGSCRITSSWRTFGHGTRMVQVSALIAGRYYTGRGQGGGMYINLRTV